MNIQLFDRCISSLNSGKSSKIILTECYKQRLSEFLKLRNGNEDNIQNLIDKVCESKNINLMIYLMIYLMDILPQELNSVQSFLMGYFGGKKNDD